MAEWQEGAPDPQREHEWPVVVVIRGVQDSPQGALGIVTAASNLASQYEEHAGYATETYHPASAPNVLSAEECALLGRMNRGEDSNSDAWEYGDLLDRLESYAEQAGGEQ